ncbi:hypothetical protein TSUD_115230 [Trifolium subterraneum]|uniref:Uncharacterized protein n=1 Tax=Trifolium subterraneum TaxID=3900 RepID=A0A2Z6MCF6_TRISU|nr:hypothetical protein TSUD_115230 [Trifolium subterraneum]
MGSMKRESNSIKQSKIKHYVLTPVRILKRAKELYVKGMMACSGKISVSHLPAVDHSNQSIVNVNTSRINGSERQSLREIFITAPINEMRLITNGEQRVVTIRNNIVGSESVVMQRRQRQRNAGYKYNRNKMSYQTEVRKMGRIDEDKPCYFEEDESDHSISKANLLYLYPRSSRTNTVVKSQVK